jgi:hypothetical protein
MSNPIPSHPTVAPRRLHRLSALVVAAVAALGSAHAGLRVERLAVTRRRGVYYLSGRLHIAPNSTVRHALLHGIPVTLNLKIRIVDSPSFLFWGGTAARIDQRYRIAYHTVLERYVVRNLATGVQTSYPTFERVVLALQRLHQIPLVDTSLLAPHQHYRVRARIVLRVDNIPHALRWLVGLWTNWESSSPWTSARLAP